ncbi:MAG: hypothetical protein FWG08_05725 [Propionibacteriaceae bacterium]|nr:hypothetical protein [Propionibacteriaceae bacterium]
MDDMAPKRGFISWKAVRTVFIIGAAYWVAWLALTLIQVRLGFPFYVGIPISGGEVTSWVGPGWIVDFIWCFDTQEYCASHPSAPYFSFDPLLMAPYCGVVTILAFLVGLISGHRRRTRATISR